MTTDEIQMIPTADLLDELARRHPTGLVLAAFSSEPDQPPGRYELRKTGDWVAVAALVSILNWHLSRMFTDDGTVAVKENRDE